MSQKAEVLNLEARLFWAPSPSIQEALVLFKETLPVLKTHTCTWTHTKFPLRLG